MMDIYQELEAISNNIQANEDAMLRELTPVTMEENAKVFITEVRNVLKSLAIAVFPQRKLIVNISKWGLLGITVNDEKAFRETIVDCKMPFKAWRDKHSDLGAAKKFYEDNHTKYTVVCMKELRKFLQLRNMEFDKEYEINW